MRPKNTKARVEEAMAGASGDQLVALLRFHHELSQEDKAQVTLKQVMARLERLEGKLGRIEAGLVLAKGGERWM